MRFDGCKVVFVLEDAKKGCHFLGAMNTMKEVHKGLWENFHSLIHGFDLNLCTMAQVKTTKPLTNMNAQGFPRDYFVSAMVQLLDTIQHKDTNFTHEERVDRLRHVYLEASQHFAQPHVYKALKVSPKKLEAGLRTIALLIVDCWVRCSKEVMAALTIYFTYILVADDTEEDPAPKMETFVEDLTAGRTQKHPWMKLMNDFMPRLLKYYGPYSKLNIYRSTIDCKYDTSGSRP